MTTREQLNSIKDYSIRIRNKQEELLQLEAISAGSKNQEREKVQISYAGSETENLAIELAAVQQEIAEERIKLIQKQKELVSLIECVNNAIIYNILHKRYVQCKSWNEITKETGYSKSHIYSLHKKGIRIIEEINKGEI